MMSMSEFTKIDMMGTNGLGLLIPLIVYICDNQKIVIMNAKEHSI